MRMLDGHEVEEASEEVTTNIRMVPFIHGLVRILPEGWLYPGTAPTFLNRIQTMEFRTDDVVVTTFPKCGTTWMQEIVWTMLHNPNLDNPAAEEPIMMRSPDLSFDMIFDSEFLGGSPIESLGKKFDDLHVDRNKEDGIMVELTKATKSPRVIKNHYPLSLLPVDILSRVKMVYVCRNPKDMVVSFWHFFKSVNVHQFSGDLESFARLIMSDGMIYCPYWSHVLEAWHSRHHPNLHFVFYEDLQADVVLELQKLNEFLGTHLSQETLDRIRRHTSFHSMKARGEPLPDKVFDKEEPQQVVFFRKGTTGDWKSHFSPELQQEMDQWIEKNLTGTGLSPSWAFAR